MSEDKSTLWYSAKQRAVQQEPGYEYVAHRDFHGGTHYTAQESVWRPTYGKLSDGREVEYTQVCHGDEKPLWDDAVCLGEGKYFRSGEPVR